MKKKAIIIDLDGTLCNNEHRQHFMTGPKKDWKNFYYNIPWDKPNEWCLEIVNKFIEAGYFILFVTGREFKQCIKLDTLRWLRDHDLKPKEDSNIQIFARKEGDFRSDDIVKKEIYFDNIASQYEILFALDDRKRVVEMWRSIGLTCLQCAEGNF